MTKKIAHIDDDPDIRDTVKRVLEMHGYQVDSYHTSSDFIILRKFPIWLYSM